MLRTLAVNLLTASNSAQSPSNFLFTFATPRAALLLLVMSAEARLSSLRPAHVAMDNSTNIAADEIEGTDTSGAVKDNFAVVVTNEEQQFMLRHDNNIRLSSLDEHDELLAQNLVRKGVYSISNDSNTLIRETNGPSA